MCYSRPKARGWGKGVGRLVLDDREGASRMNKDPSTHHQNKKIKKYKVPSYLSAQSGSHGHPETGEPPDRQLFSQRIGTYFSDERSAGMRSWATGASGSASDSPS